MPSVSGMRLLMWALGLLLLVTGCGPQAKAPAPPDLPAPPPPPRAADEKAVLTTLANTNPCLLVDAAQQKMSYLARPHECELDMSDGDGQLLFVGRAEQQRRAALPTKVVDGVQVDTVMENGRDCSMDLPVSRTFAIRVSATRDAKPCDAAAKLVTTVLGRIDDLGQAAHKDAMPDLKKDACGVLAAAVTDAGLGTATGTAIGMPGDLDGCAVDVGELHNVQLEFRAHPDPAKDGWSKSATIAGRTVYRRPGPCGWGWSEGPLPDSFSRDYVRLVTLTSNDCPSDLPKKLVPALVAQLGKPAAPTTVNRLPIQN